MLVLIAAIALGLVIPALLSAHKLSSSNQKIAIYLVSLFAVGLVITTAMTDVTYTAIYGEYQRNNGFHLIPSDGYFDGFWLSSFYP